MKIFGYVRVSTSDQCKGKSIESQENDIKMYCKLCGQPVYEIFKDIAVSGALAERDGLTLMLNSLTTEEPCLIVVQSVDRLWRNENVMSVVKEKIKNAGADVISIMQPLYSIYKKTEIIDRYNSNVDYSAEESRKEINEKFAKARMIRAKTGNKPCGTAPYGYKWQGNEIVIDFNNNLIVQDIFEQYIKLKSLAKLKSYCDSKNYKTSTGKDFSKQALKNIIENDFYIGIVTYAGKKTNGEHEPIIEKTIFEVANEVLKR